VPTPRTPDGRYAVIPYSLKTNVALDATRADYIAYLTNDSMPLPGKYALMAKALDENPDWGAVYCTQEYSGPNGSGMRSAINVMQDAYCQVDHTQVMHRLTEDRWDLDVGKMKLGDAHFWRKLHARLGAFYPVAPLLDVVQQTPDGLTKGY